MATSVSQALVAYSSNSTQAATNKKIQGAFMDMKNNGVSAAMKYKDDAEVTGILKDVFMS